MIFIVGLCFVEMDLKIWRTLSQIFSINNVKYFDKIKTELLSRRFWQQFWLFY